MITSRLMTTIPMTPSQRRSSSNSMVNILRQKTILGFYFNGINKTIWLEEAKQAHLLMFLHGWIYLSKAGMIGSTFKEFKSVVTKIRHAFTAILAGRGLLTLCNKILQTKLLLVYLQHNLVLQAAIMGCQALLWESSNSPT
jgi:hypothetical protein